MCCWLKTTINLWVLRSMSSSTLVFAATYSNQVSYASSSQEVTIGGPLSESSSVSSHRETCSDARFEQQWMKNIRIKSLLIHQDFGVKSLAVLSYKSGNKLPKIMCKICYQYWSINEYMGKISHGWYCPKCYLPLRESDLIALYVYVLELLLAKKIVMSLENFEKILEMQKIKLDEAFLLYFLYKTGASSEKIDAILNSLRASSLENKNVLAEFVSEVCQDISFYCITELKEKIESKINRNTSLTDAALIFQWLLNVSGHCSASDYNELLKSIFDHKVKHFAKYPLIKRSYLSLIMENLVVKEREDVLESANCIAKVLVERMDFAGLEILQDVMLKEYDFFKMETLVPIIEALAVKTVRLETLIRISAKMQENAFLMNHHVYQLAMLEVAKRFNSTMEENGVLKEFSLAMLVVSENYFNIKELILILEKVEDQKFYEQKCKSWKRIWTVLGKYLWRVKFYQLYSSDVVSIAHIDVLLSITPEGFISEDELCVICDTILVSANSEKYAKKLIERLIDNGHLSWFKKSRYVDGLKAAQNSMAADLIDKKLTFRNYLTKHVSQ
ncbi:hypothetical protein ENBRE01_1547 [Enteropsectra breve]|nr:hypothetical protein ENBRE01_1547 [Enteropsectra breve]